MANIDKLNSLATDNSNWLEEAKKRQKNKFWLKHSQKIAIKVLRTLREKNIKQKELAKMIKVSPQQINKIVKGRENLTLETISKLEQALEINLIEIKSTDNYLSQEYKLNKNNIYISYKNPQNISNKKIEYYSNDYVFLQNIVNDKNENYG